jgi:hypothetical protein
MTQLVKPSEEDEAKMGICNSEEGTVQETA